MKNKYPKNYSKILEGTIKAFPKDSFEEFPQEILKMISLHISGKHLLKCLMKL